MKDLSAMSDSELADYLDFCETQTHIQDKSQHATLLCPYCREVVHFSLYRSHCQTMHDINIPTGYTPRYLEERYAMLGGITWVS